MLAKERKLQKYNPDVSIRENAKELNVSTGTMWTWLHTDMSLVAQKECKAQSGPKRKLNSLEEQEIFAWIQR